jgi:hypothetical protein
MALKIGSKTMERVKGGRGLAYDTMAYLAREEVTLIPTIVVETIGQLVTPGQETEILVSLARLRANADVKRMKATLRVYQDAGPAPAPNTLHVQEGEAPERTFVVSAEGPPGLSNVALRLNPGEVFWTHAGRLAPGDHAIPIDIAEQVNAYLDRTAHAEGAITLKFMLKSDTPGRVLIQIGAKDYEYTLLQTQTWPNDLDGTLRADRNLTLDFSTVERLPLAAIAPVDGRATALAEIRMDVSGQFGPERLLESIEDPSRGEFGTISSEYTLARGFILDPDTVKGGAVQCAGFSAFVRVTEEAEIYAELQVEAAPVAAAPGTAGAAAAPAAAIAATAPAATGTTSTGAASLAGLAASLRAATVESPAPTGTALTIPAAGAPLAKANLVIAPPPEAQGQPSERWVFVRWETPAEIQVGVPYWVVIKGIRGQAFLGLRSDGAALSQASGTAGRAVREEEVRINRGGQLWKSLQRAGRSVNGNSIRARLALVYTPGPDNGVAAVKISVEGSQAAAALIDPGAQAETVALNLGGAALSNAVLVVRSNASGTFTVANVIQEYRPA